MVEEKEKEEEEIKGDFIKYFLAYIRSDKLAITLFILALIACAYTIYTVGDYQQKINTYWLDQLEELNCRCSRFPIGFNESPSLPLTHMQLPVKQDPVIENVAIT